MADSIAVLGEEVICPPGFEDLMMIFGLETGTAMISLPPNHANGNASSTGLLSPFLSRKDVSMTCLSNGLISPAVLKSLYAICIKLGGFGGAGCASGFNHGSRLNVNKLFA
jgi:hypothetical protein